MQALRPILLVALVTAAACGQRSSGTISSAAATSTSTTGAAATKGHFTAVDSQGAEAFDITVDGASITLKCRGKEIGSETKGDKRKYSGAGAIAEVKQKDDSFKLRDSDGKLLFKVKVQPDKIKVGTEEEGDLPLSIKGGKVEDSDKRIGKFKFDGTKVKVENEAGVEAWSGTADRNSDAFGVLVMPGLSDEARCVIAAEIAARGR